MKQSTIDSIQDTLRDVIGEDDITITAETTAADIEGWDSLANVRLFIALEGVFGAQFNALEIEGLKNVGEIAELIENKVG